MASHFRLRARYPIEVRVSVRRQHEKSARKVDATTVNLSFGGAFVAVDPPMPVGARLRVAIASATTWEPLELDATVRWVRDGGATVRAGMGLMFEPLTPQQATAMHSLICAHGFEDE
ncbi:MAG: PilZ domain-containing protein [Myxococcales bacterium]|nr:PilZ domain-containing protein [Myxococcales bacterium]